MTPIPNRSARRGIILAGGSGTRLHPITHSISKQLLPVYDKPMIYYPLSVLMLAGIREVAIITTPADQDQFRRLLGDGHSWGMNFTYIVQARPEGLAQAYLLAEDFLDGAGSTMVLGDNIFFGHGLPEILEAAGARETGGTVFGYQVRDPERYGVVAFDRGGQVTSIEEKPKAPKSSFAVTGLYVLDGSAPERARAVRPSDRGELEITDLLNMYRADGLLQVERMGRGFAWLDTGTHGSLLEAGNFVRTIEERQNLKVGCPEEIAFAQAWISADALRALAEPYLKTEYGRYLVRVAEGGEELFRSGDSSKPGLK
jgi:glucose-1-phosphate thymidylyltransferase